MSKVRVHELAKELHVEAKVLLTKLKTMGANITNVQNTLTDQQVAEVRRSFTAGAQVQADVGSGGGKPRVVIRRRAATKDEHDVHSGSADPEAELAQPQAHEAAPSDQPEEAEEMSSAAIEAQAPHMAPEAEEAPVAAAVTAAGARSAPETAQAEEPTLITSSAEPVQTHLDQVASEPQRPTLASQPVVRPATPPAGITAEVAVPATAPVSVTVVAAQGAHAGPVALPTSPPAPASPPAARPAAAAAETSAADMARRRREVIGGATIVRRATPEEVEKLESQNRSRLTGRKEDHRGTRVTGLGLLSNRISAGEGGGGGLTGFGGGGGGGGGVAPGSPQPPPLPLEEEDWGQRRGGVKDRRGQEEAEEAARKKAAKARRTNVAFNPRAILQEVDESVSEDESAPVVPEAAVPRTVYTPTAPRNRRDLRRRKDLKKTMITTPRASYRVVTMGETISVGELARQLAVKATDLIKKLMGQGIMATINQSVDADTATLIANEYHFEVKSAVETVEDIISKAADAGGDAESRPPIVTIMGHVDHGKTSLLDAIRSANVAGGEAGGITQHIGAYSVSHRGKPIAFLDTPGHEAFSAMRARGAKVTDIVVLVVAADDGVMPQTKEAISHAKAAKVPLIVAVNKIDKPNINLDRVYTELTEQGVQAEEWGGEVQFIKTSAVKRQGIEDLLDGILLQAEVLDLKTTHQGFASGTVIEAHLDKGRGPVATVIVQSGTLRVGDYLVAGTEHCRVRAMADHLGKQVDAAGPSQPVEIIGLSGVPMAGDSINVVVDEKTAREAALWRVEQAKKAQAAKSSAASLADLLAKVKNEEVPEVPLIVKGDTQGSVGAITESVLKLSTPKVKNRIVHGAVGGVTESDITLAAATGAVIIAFNVRAARGLDDQAERAGVMIRYFSIIYEIVDAVKAIMVGKLPPVVSEVVLGHAEVRKPISVPKIGTIAGSAVTDGKISRNAHCRLIRNDVVIYTGKLGSLRRFKDDVKEVVQGYECGIGIDGYNELKEGDVIEAFVLEETAATL